VPSRARSGGAPRAGFHVLVEGVADLPLERPQHLFGGLARGDLLVIVGAAVGVPAADLGDRGLWMAWFSRRFPRSDSRQMMRLPEDTSAGAVPLQAAKQSRAGEPGDVADVAGHGGGHRGASAGHLGHGGAAGPDRRGQLAPGVASRGVEAAQAGQELAGQLAAGRLDRAARGRSLGTGHCRAPMAG